ncbi:MAG: universal stress protein [Stackebrandtia sp.]
MSSEQTKRIVCGVDGSEPSKEALRWAVKYAASVEGEVEAVIAWQYAGTYYDTVPMALHEDGVRETLNTAIVQAVGVDPPVKVHPRMVIGDPSQVLINAADGAELLVVGNRGHGVFTYALLGSVSSRCAHHANCPVTVVRTPKKDD